MWRISDGLGELDFEKHRKVSHGSFMQALISVKIVGLLDIDIRAGFFPLFQASLKFLFLEF